MTEEEPVRSLPNRPRRHCPDCGARVADGAKTCLMCGALLQDEGPDRESGASQAPPEAAQEHAHDPGASHKESASFFSSPRWGALRTALLALVALVVLAAAVILGMSLSQGDLAQELPTFTPTITNTPTTAPTATPTATATPTPPPTNTPTPLAPIEHVVQAGDTLLAIALDYDLTIDEITAYNQLESELIVEGQTLLIPPPTPTPGPTPTPRPGQPTPTAAAFVLHTVRTGDTLSTIAQEYGVSVQSIREANDIPADSESIQVNQVLTVPLPTPTPPSPSAAPSTPTPTPGLVSYRAPALLYPPDGASFEGPDAVVALQWSTIGILENREFYCVELVAPQGGDTEILESYTRSTVWRVPNDLYPSDTAGASEYSWRVYVVRQVTEGPDADYKIVGQTGRRRSFTWGPEQPATP